MRCTLLAVVILFTVAGFASASPYSFRSIELGETLSELRAGHPFDGSPELKCNDIANSDFELFRLGISLSRDEVWAGLTKCAYNPLPKFDHYVLSSVVISLTTLGGGEPRVFDIKAESLFSYDEIREGLVSKLGSPKSSEGPYVSWTDGIHSANLSPHLSSTIPGGFELDMYDVRGENDFQVKKRSYRAPAAPI